MAAYLTPYFVLRFICAFFFIPHIVGKFTARAASEGFFRAAGFRPPGTWVWVAMFCELVLTALLLANFRIYVVGWLACAYLAFAAAAVLKVSKRWLWHIGGCEFPLFWAICCGVLAAMSPR
jgi:uncharacterized membrane protein YphA (DoxX/SURF4 family)